MTRIKLRFMKIVLTYIYDQVIGDNLGYECLSLIDEIDKKLEE